MVRRLLVRGMLAGLLAGIVGFLFARQLGEPPVNTAIAFGAYVESNVHTEQPEVELVARSLQSSAGLGTGTLIYGVALGGMFALVFVAIYGRLGPLAARGTASGWTVRRVGCRIDRRRRLPDRHRAVLRRLSRHQRGTPTNTSVRVGRGH